MVKQTHKPSDWSEAFNQQAAVIASTQGAVLQTWTQVVQGCADSMSAMTSEASDFLTARLNHDAEFAQSVCDCGSWAELAEVQQNWMRRASEAYFNEARKFTGFGLSLYGAELKASRAAASPAKTSK